MLFIGNLGTTEIILLLVVLIIFVGPSKLPSFAKTAGKWFRNVKQTGDELRSKIEDELYAEDDDSNVDAYRARTAYLERDAEKPPVKPASQPPGSDRPLESSPDSTDQYASAAKAESSVADALAATDDDSNDADSSALDGSEPPPIQKTSHPGDSSPTDPTADETGDRSTDGAAD